MRTAALALTLALSLLAACAPRTLRPAIDPRLAADEAALQRSMAVQAELEMRRRLHRVGAAVLLANADLCGDMVAPLAGLEVLDLDALGDDWRPAFARELGQDAGVVVISAPAGSPAAEAGILPGDRILAVGGLELPAKGGKAFAKALDTALKTGGPVALRLAREGREAQASIAPRQACASEIILFPEKDVNALATGDQIFVFQGLLGFVRSDDELALIVGHELAHNSQKHIRAKMGNRALGAIVGSALQVLTGLPVGSLIADAGGALNSQGFEAEADYVGLYHSARAGFDIAHAPELWRRMAVQTPGAIAYGSTHPATSERFVLLEATAREIEGKRTRGEALRPEFQDTANK
jgi:hypothetical protein